MSTFDRPWALCGGWAAESWTGISRKHGDIDILIWEDDQGAAFELFRDWNAIAHDEVAGQVTDVPWDGRTLVLPAHGHARLPSGHQIELVFNRQTNGEWVLYPGKPVTLPVAECVTDSPWGVPVTTPLVIAFYKATAYWGEVGMRSRYRDRVDFTNLLPLVTGTRREWLRDQIVAWHGWHPWLELFEPR